MERFTLKEALESSSSSDTLGKERHNSEFLHPRPVSVKKEDEHITHTGCVLCIHPFV